MLPWWNTAYTADSKSAARYMFIVYLPYFDNKHTAGMRVRIPPGVRQRRYPTSTQCCLGVSYRDSEMDINWVLGVMVAQTARTRSS